MSTSHTTTYSPTESTYDGESTWNSTIATRDVENRFADGVNYWRHEDVTLDYATQHNGDLSGGLIEVEQTSNPAAGTSDAPQVKEGAWERPASEQGSTKGGGSRAPGVAVSVSVVGAFFGGLGTGVKAVFNGASDTVANTVTVGGLLGDPSKNPFKAGYSDYELAIGAARSEGITEVVVGFLPVPKTGLLGQAVGAFDKANEINDAVQAGVNVVQNGINPETIIQTAATAATLPAARRASFGGPQQKGVSGQSNVAPTTNAGQVGSYTNTHASGATYSGKGTQARSQQSGRKQARAHDDPHVATDFTPAENAREAFKQESRRIDANGGVRDPSNFNQIESPGRRFRIEDGELLE